jgi:hypothetical protein
MNGLLATWAFVVQFRAATDIEAGRVNGRVEHVVSGRTANFETGEELLAVLNRMMNDVQSEATADPDSRCRR